MNYKWERGKDGTAYPRAQAQSGQHSQGEHPVVYLWINQTCFPVLQDEVGAGDGAERGLGVPSLRGDEVLGGTSLGRGQGVGGHPLCEERGCWGAPPLRGGRVFGVYPPCSRGAGGAPSFCRMQGAGVGGTLRPCEVAGVGGYLPRKWVG